MPERIAEDNAGPQGAAANAAEPLRVLLVDDNADLLETMACIIEMLGHTVEQASDGRAGLEAALARPPDVVLLDIGLPDMDGYEVARQLRTRWGMSRQPLLVAVTGYCQIADRDHARQAGFDRHLVKPVDMDAVEKILGEVAAARAAGPPGICEE